MKQNGAENIEQSGPQNVPSILTKRKLFPGDRVLWVIVIMFFAISLVAVYTASSQVGLRDGNLDRELHRHVVSLGISAGILIFFYLLGSKLMYRWSWVAYGLALILTILPYFIGGAINHAARWLNLGFFKFQPSELLKIGTILILAAQLSDRQQRIKSVRLLPSTFDVRKWNTPKELGIIKGDVLPIVLPIALSCIVILPAHTSSAIHIFFVSMVLLFIAGIRFKEIAKLVAVGAICGLTILIIWGRWETVLNRIKIHFGIEVVQSDSKKKSANNKDTYYSKMAIQNGGVFGVGAGRSMMRSKLMHTESDYIFALIVEEFGLLLSFVIVLLYLWLFFRSLRIFERSEWLFGGLLAVGLALLVTSQGFLHVGVTLGILPETGQNLPFITRGRTGMFCASIAVGIILSISRQVDQGTLLAPSQMDGNKNI